MNFWDGQLSYIQNIFLPIIIGFLVFSPVLAAAFAFGFVRRWLLWRVGGKDSRKDNMISRIKDTIAVALANVRILSESYPGWMHFMIVWGAILFVLGKLIRLFSYTVHINNPPQDVFLYASFASEVGAVLIIVGGLLAVFRRYILKPPRLDTKSDDTLIFLWVFVILLTGFMVKGFRIATADTPPTDWYKWAPVSYGFSKILPAFARTYYNHILLWHRVLFHTVVAFTVPGVHFRHPIPHAARLTITLECLLPLLETEGSAYPDKPGDR